MTAETVIPKMEDVEAYEAFKIAITSEYDAETAVQRELILWLASLLWPLRRLRAFETASSQVMLPANSDALMAKGIQSPHAF